MLLEIDDNKTIGDLKDKFNQWFPYLSLKFYHHAHKQPAANDEIPETEQLSNIRHKHDSGVITLKSSISIDKLITALKKQFGLHVHIFRLHKEEWIHCSEEGYTLKELSNLSDVSCKKNSELINDIDEEDIYYNI